MWHTLQTTERPASRASTATSMETTGTMATEQSAAAVEDAQDMAGIEDMEGMEFVEEEMYWPRLQQPSKNPATAPWNITISPCDFDRLKQGFSPREFNDRWYIKAMPDEEVSNLTLVYFNRFMADASDYAIVIHTSSASGEEKTAIVAIIWETVETLESLTGDDVISEDYAKREVVYLARNFLECELPGLEGLRYEEWWPKWCAYHNRLLESVL